MGKKSKTTSHATSQSVSTPNNPQWAVDAVQGLSQGVQDLGRLDPASLAAPASGLEVLAQNRAFRLGGQTQAYDEAADWTRAVGEAQAPQIQAGSLLDNLDAYANPYRQQVTDAAMADFDAEAGRMRAQQDLSLAGAGAFGGSGAALTRAQTEGELARARNTQLSGLLSNMFNTSAALSSQDADRRQQAAQVNAQMWSDQASRRLQAAQTLSGLAGARAAGEREDIAAQAALGAQMRGIDQAQRLAPYTALSSQADILSRLPLELFQGRTVNETRQGTERTTQTPGLTDFIDLALRAAGK